MKKFSLVVIAVLFVVFTCGTAMAGPVVNWTGLTANGVSGSETTALLTFEFDGILPKVHESNFSFLVNTGGNVQRGVLAGPYGSGPYVYTLPIMLRSVADGATVTVAVAGSLPENYVINPNSMQVVVHVAPGGGANPSPINGTWRIKDVNAEGIENGEQAVGRFVPGSGNPGTFSAVMEQTGNSYWLTFNGGREVSFRWSGTIGGRPEEGTAQLDQAHGGLTKSPDAEKYTSSYIHDSADWLTEIELSGDGSTLTIKQEIEHIASGEEFKTTFVLERVGSGTSTGGGGGCNALWFGALALLAVPFVIIRRK